MAKCSSSSSFESESSLPDGYCLWQWDGARWRLWSCHCRQGYECENPNTGGAAAGDYYGELRKFPCLKELP